MALSINRKKGITLIELVLYMSLFVILVIGVAYSAIYLQKTIEYNAFEYKARERIYTQLMYLQGFLSLAKNVDIKPGRIIIYMQDKIVTQEIREGRLYMKYQYGNDSVKEMEPYPGMMFDSFSLEPIESPNTLYTKSLLRVEITRQDSKGNPKRMTEYILWPKVDFSTLP